MHDPIHISGKSTVWGCPDSRVVRKLVVQLFLTARISKHKNIMGNYLILIRKRSYSVLYWCMSAVAWISSLITYTGPDRELSSICEITVNLVGDFTTHSVFLQTCLPEGAQGSMKRVKTSCFLWIPSTGYYLINYWVSFPNLGALLYRTEKNVNVLRADCDWKTTFLKV